MRAGLDPTSRVPLYEQIERTIAEAAGAGVLPPGAMLPPEPELARALGVSRQTANQALTRLARRGVVTRRRGVGTTIAAPTVEQPLGGLYSFVRSLLAQGRTPSSRLLGHRLTVDGRASPLLGGSPDALVVEIGRLRLVDGEPLIVETAFLPAGCAEELPLDRLTAEPLYDLLRERCGVEITHAEETLRPVTLGRREAALLGLTEGDPAFLVERIGYAGERPAELRESIVRGDRYRFRVHLAGPLGGGGED